MRLFKLLILSAILCSFTACGTDPGTGGQGPDPVTSTCGNGTLDAGEECDGSKLRDADCAALDSSKIGKLTCDNTCHYVKTQCKDKSPGSGSCGNGTLDTGEECDGSKLRDADCAALDSSKIGKLTCDGSCHYVKTQCVPKPATCGDGNLDPGEECDGTHLKETDCSKVDATKVGTLTCVVGGCTYNRSACTDKPTPHTIAQDAPCSAVDACKPDLACLPEGITPDASTCQPVNNLGCTKDGDCTDHAKPYCVKRRSMGKDISFCSAEKQCTNSTECSSDEYCLSKDADFSRGVCTKVKKCTDDTSCTSTEKCVPGFNVVPQGFYPPTRMCVPKTAPVQAGGPCSATTDCQKGLICASNLNRCTLKCSVATPKTDISITYLKPDSECTTKLANVCFKVKTTEGTDTLACIPYFKAH